MAMMSTSNDTSHEDEEDQEDGPVDFLQSMKMTGDDNDDYDNIDNGEGITTTKPAAESMQGEPDEPHYNPKKPLWWKKISGRPTKAQKRSIDAMASFRLPRVEWGQFIDWGAVFSNNKTTTEADNDANNNTNNTSTNAEIENNHPQGTTDTDIWLEIGFGTGDNLLALAQKYPHKCFVGAEVHSSGIGKLCQRMHWACLQNEYWNGYTAYSEELMNRKTNLPDAPKDEEEAEDVELDIPTDAPFPDLSTSSTPIPYSNLRIYGGDGVKLLPYIPTSSLAAVLVTFPDPFEKQKQSQYRVIQTHTLMAFYRILKPHGRLFLATDHEGHYEWCQEKVNQANGSLDNKNVTEDSSELFTMVKDLDRTEWLPVISKYEQKGWNEGRTTHLSCWEVSK